MCVVLFASCCCIIQSRASRAACSHRFEKIENLLITYDSLFHCLFSRTRKLSTSFSCFSLIIITSSSLLLPCCRPPTSISTSSYDIIYFQQHSLGRRSSYRWGCVDRSREEQSSTLSLHNYLRIIHGVFDRVVMFSFLYFCEVNVHYLNFWGGVSLRVALPLDGEVQAFRPPTSTAIMKMVPFPFSLFPSEIQNRSARRILREWWTWLVSPSHNFTVRHSNTTEKLLWGIWRFPTILLKIIVASDSFNSAVSIITWKLIRSWIVQIQHPLY